MRIAKIFETVDSLTTQDLEFRTNYFKDASGGYTSKGFIRLGYKIAYINFSDDETFIKWFVQEEEIGREVPPEFDERNEHDLWGCWRMESDGAIITKEIEESFIKRVSASILKDLENSQIKPVNAFNSLLKRSYRGAGYYQIPDGIIDEMRSLIKGN